MQPDTLFDVIEQLKRGKPSLYYTAGDGLLVSLVSWMELLNTIPTLIGHCLLHYLLSYYRLMCGPLHWPCISRTMPAFTWQNTFESIHLHWGFQEIV